MQGNWNYPYPHPYQQPYHQPQPYNPNQAWNDHAHYNQGQQPFYRQITITEAMNIALAQVPGQVIKVELDTEQGVQVYEVTIVTAQNTKYEVSVNINNGEIVEIELD